MDSDIIAGNPPIGLQLLGDNVYILDGETLTLDSSWLNVEALSGTRIDLINGAHLTINPEGINVSALSNITYGIGQDCALTLHAPSANINLFSSTIIDFDQSQGTGTFEYVPSNLSIDLAKPTKIINLHEGDKIRVEGATSAEMKGNILHFKTSIPTASEPEPSHGLLGRLIKTVGKVVDGVTNTLEQVLGDKASFEVHPNAGFNYVQLSNAGELTTTVPCFLSGTLISTPNGEIPIEKLKNGDAVYTMNGGVASVIWTGHRAIDPKAVDRLRDHAPIRIHPSALDHDTPNRDLYVSPDHCLFLSGSLIPAKFLVNDTSITQDATLEPFTYHHIELEQHDVLIAEGAYAESYLDLDNRAKFLEPGTLMFTSSASQKNTVHCYPPVYCGPILEGIRKTLEQRATELGYGSERAVMLKAPPTLVFPFIKQIQ